MAAAMGVVGGGCGRAARLGVIGVVVLGAGKARCGGRKRHFGGHYGIVVEAQGVEIKKGVDDGSIVASKVNFKIGDAAGYLEVLVRILMKCTTIVLILLRTERIGQSDHKSIRRGFETNRAEGSDQREMVSFRQGRRCSIPGNRLYGLRQSPPLPLVKLIPKSKRQ